MPRVRRTKLEQYPCADAWYGAVLGLSGGCHHDNEPCILADKCQVLPIYHQAIADAHCARLLGIFERWLLETIENCLRWYDSFMQAYDKPPSGILERLLVRLPRFRRYIRDALRMAGLGEQR